MSNNLFMQIWCPWISYLWPYNMTIKMNRKFKILMILNTKPWHVQQQGHRDVNGIYIYKTGSFKFQ